MTCVAWVRYHLIGRNKRARTLANVVVLLSLSMLFFLRRSRRSESIGFAWPEFDFAIREDTSHKDRVRVLSMTESSLTADWLFNTTTGSFWLPKAPSNPISGYESRLEGNTYDTAYFKGRSGFMISTTQTLIPSIATLVQRWICLKGTAHLNPVLDTRTYEVEFPDGQVAEYSANVIAENMYSQCDQEGNQYLLLDEIIDWQRDDTAVGKEDMYVNAKNGNQHYRKTTKGWKLCVKWRDESTSWLRLATVVPVIFVCLCAMCQEALVCLLGCIAHRANNGLTGIKPVDFVVFFFRDCLFSSISNRLRKLCRGHLVKILSDVFEEDGFNFFLECGPFLFVMVEKTVDDRVFEQRDAVVILFALFFALLFTSGHWVDKAEFKALGKVVSDNTVPWLENSCACDSGANSLAHEDKFKLPGSLVIS